MIELRILGGLDVRDANGPPLATAFSRPKPLALLVYLALARPRGFHSQDALLARFWPESDTDRGRASLRQAVHVLRRALGDGTVVRRGRAELGLDMTQVWCDAVEFERAVDEGRPGDAVASYGGDLLPAYFIPDAPDAEAWLDTERARLRALAVSTVRTLVDEAPDSAAAATWAERWIALEPDDEAPVRVAVQHFERAGDPAGALRVYDTHVARLARLDDGPPSAALQAFADRLRNAAPLPLVALAPAPAVVEPTVVEAADGVAAPLPLLPAAPTEDARTPPPRRSRSRARAALVGVAALAAVAMAIAVNGRRAPAHSMTPAVTAAAARRVVVLPFVVRGPPATAYLREAMVELLSAKLDGADGVTAVDPRTLLAYVQTAPDGTPAANDVARGQAAARRFGAGQFVVGSVISAGGRLEVTAALYDADGHRRASADAAGASEASLFTVADALARSLLAGEVGGPDASLSRTATATTTSLPALKAFLEGEQHLRDKEPAAATEAYERAVRYDTTFALAYYRLSTTTAWNVQPGLVHEATLRARRYADRLPRVEQLLLRGNAASNAGAFEDSEALYTALLAANPDMPEALRQLAELRYHLGPWRGRPLAAARDAFARLAAVDSTDVGARLHLARIAALDGRAREADSLADAALRLRPERGVVLELRALRAALSGDGAAVRRALDTLQTAVGRPTPYGDDDAWLVAWRVATYADAPGVGREIDALLTAPDIDPHLQLLGHTAAAHMDAALGRWAAADRELTTAAALDDLYAAEVRANLALIAATTLDPRVAAAVVGPARAALARVGAGGAAARDAAEDSTIGRASDRVAHDRDALLAVRRPYLLGALAVAAGDTAEVARAARALAAASKAAGAEGDLARHLAHQLAARVLWARGDAAGALRDTEEGWPGHDRATALPLLRGETYTHATERVLRGDLLRAVGRDREALAWYESAAEDLGASVALAAPVHLRRAAVLARLGDGAGAAAQSARAAALWADADPALQGAARAARAAAR